MPPAWPDLPLLTHPLTSRNRCPLHFFQAVTTFELGTNRAVFVCLSASGRRGTDRRLPAASAPALRLFGEAAAQTVTRLQHSLSLPWPRPPANVRGESQASARWQQVISQRKAWSSILFQFDKDIDLICSSVKSVSILSLQLVFFLL